MRIIALFNLTPEADVGAYEEWARARNLPGVRALVSVKDFAIYRATGVLFSEKSPPYRYIEVIDVDGLETFLEDVKSDAIETLANEMGAFADDVVFLSTERLPEVV